MKPLISRHSLSGIAAMLITLAASTRASAAIAKGPNETNAVAAEQRRLSQFYQAEQSFQDQLRVGRERYNRKQANRDNIIAAMSAELQARQETVVSQPLPVPDAKADEPVGWFRPSLAVAGLAVGFIGFGHYVKRQRDLEASVQNQEPLPDSEPPPVVILLREETFYCQGEGADGRGRYTDDGFVVLQGSVGCKENDRSGGGQSSEPLWVKLLEAGVTREEGDYLVFEQDHVFRSPSMAAIALMGRKANGWLEWKTKDGITLDTVQRLEPRE